MKGLLNQSFTPHETRAASFLLPALAAFRFQPGTSRFRILGCRERGLDEFALHQARQTSEEATKADF